MVRPREVASTISVEWMDANDCDELLLARCYCSCWYRHFVDGSQSAADTFKIPNLFSFVSFERWMGEQWLAAASSICGRCMNGKCCYIARCTYEERWAMRIDDVMRWQWCCFPCRFRCMIFTFASWGNVMHKKRRMIRALLCACRSKDRLLI